ncbi:purine-cytosine permease family protein [Pseudonocardia endophytica]|uniref:Purine-cytosine permease-like protein n=1 Tax=Pseudonocardia endophytica TaxID=401976 RepID=A0A4R1HJJ9_PSEEN|nr:cytosine permease [Pseudonocardia endophytica]TCK21073.1 purine-cytosine permease-like protein [Pseudonocardia endophytica]
MSITEEPADVVLRDGVYGDRVVAVEPGGAEFIPLAERHGRARQLFWTWASPNLEFATIFVGVLAVSAFSLGFWGAVAGIVVGTALGSLTHGLLSARGPRAGVPMMVLSRLGFGFRGNVLPAGLNAIVGGIGWFAVNSVSGALALSTLTGVPAWLGLLIVAVVQIGVALLGHNLIHNFEKIVLPVLAVVFAITSVVILTQVDPSYVPTDGQPNGSLAGFLLTVGATFGYAAGWNPYATDYTRYLPPSTSPRSVGLAAGLGVFVPCVVLETVGAASATLVSDPDASPTAAFTAHLPSWLAALTLLCIAVGAVAANAINIYSGALSFVALGIRLPLTLRRALAVGVFGVLGFLVALAGLSDAGHAYESFLLIIAYWIGPWLAVVFADMWLRRGQPTEHLLFDTGNRNAAGPVAMLAGIVVSILLFSNQVSFTGLVPAAVPQVGDIAFEVGFLVSGAVYLAMRGRTRRA